MKAILIEDEQSAVLNLEHQLKSLNSEIEIVELIDTVSDAIAFFKVEREYDLVFMDIHLADGISFEIMKEVEPTSPIIFTTAYDQYAIDAFKLNSIDYLLKPIREQELQNALQKFQNRRADSLISSQKIEALMDLLQIQQSQQKKFRSSFLVQKGDSYIPVASTDFAFFSIQNGVVRGTTRESVIYFFNEKLEELENELDPAHFFRVNRQYLVQRSSIKSLQGYFNSRLVLNLIPKTKEQIIVSKATSSRLKVWLNDAF